jgi:opacity protein-like surface antigen
MKSLRPLLLLPLAAVAAQAYTLELELGKNHPTGGQNSSVVGLTAATQLNESFGLGLNLNSRGVANATQDLTARTALAELTYDLNSRGGIRPFIGAGVGYSWLSGTGSASKSVLATDVFAGVGVGLSETGGDPRGRAVDAGPRGSLDRNQVHGGLGGGRGSCAVRARAVPAGAA